MNSADVIGKKIVKVHQQRVYNSNQSRFAINVSFIELEDGTKIYPSVCEGDGDYQVEMRTVKTKHP